MSDVLPLVLLPRFEAIVSGDQKGHTLDHRNGQPAFDEGFYQDYFNEALGILAKQFTQVALKGTDFFARKDIAIYNMLNALLADALL